MSVIAIDAIELDQSPEEFVCNVVENKLLGQDIAKFRLEITLCHPHTVPWMRKSYSEKMLFYKNIFREIYEWMFVNYHIVGSDRTFECKGNNFHLHGYIDFKRNIPVNPAGIVCSATAVWLRNLPKRFDHCLKGNIYDNYCPWTQRICIPQCCIQFRVIEEKRAEEWEAYIHKDDEPHLPPKDPDNWMG